MHLVQNFMKVTWIKIYLKKAGVSGPKGFYNNVKFGDINLHEGNNKTFKQNLAKIISLYF